MAKLHCIICYLSYPSVKLKWIQPPEFITATFSLLNLSQSRVLKERSKGSHTWCWSKGLTGGCCWSCGRYWELWSVGASLNPNRHSWAPGCTEEQLLLAATARRMQMKLSCASVMAGGIHLGGAKAITKMTVCVFPSSGGQQEEPLAGANNPVCTAQRDWLRSGRSRRMGTGAAYSLMISLITWGRHRLLSHTSLWQEFIKQ